MEKTLTDLKHLLKDELQKIIQKNDITPAELDNVKKALCAIKESLEIEDILYGEDGYSVRSSYAYHPHGTISYRRGRDMNTGRYVSRSDGRMSRRDRMDYSMDDGYSGHSIKDRMVAKLESMIDEAGGEHEREMINEWIDRLEMEK